MRCSRKDPGTFYFWSGEAADWLDRTVQEPTIGSLSLEQWVAEFHRLEALNEEIMRTGKASGAKATPKPRRRSKSG